MPCGGTVREAAGNKAIPFGDVTKGIADLEGGVGRLAESRPAGKKAIYDTIRGEGEYVTFKRHNRHPQAASPRPCAKTRN